MEGHTAAAYLRVYQPLAAFSARERSHWAAYVEAGRSLPATVLVVQEERHGLARALGLAVKDEPEHALVQRVGGTVYVCPLRTRLRTLESLVAFHESLPDGLSEAFVSRRDVERASRALRRLRHDQPGWQSHIRQAVWHVPLPWFALFEVEERHLTPARVGEPAGLTYQTAMQKAVTRLSRALGALRELMEDTEMVEAVEGLLEWLHGFDPDSLVQLDYGGLTRIIPFGDLVEDHSVGEVWGALQALEEGDLERSTELYGSLSERWSAVRGREASN
ncbi:MAG TPA: hypothetical protein VFA46_08760 [Actinomycetes bacterium]|jgi:uncharacterized coiled-coil protein SlyX|nr:hypothetical protein [Actinomycetes bacterium]